MKSTLKICLTLVLMFLCCHVALAEIREAEGVDISYDTQDDGSILIKAIWNKNDYRVVLYIDGKEVGTMVPQSSAMLKVIAQKDVKLDSGRYGTRTIWRRGDKSKIEDSAIEPNTKLTPKTIVHLPDTLEWKNIFVTVRGDGNGPVVVKKVINKSDETVRLFIDGEEQCAVTNGTETRVYNSAEKEISLKFRKGQSKALWKAQESD